jgi:hypothetical protein
VCSSDLDSNIMICAGHRYEVGFETDVSQNLITTS